MKLRCPAFVPAAVAIPAALILSSCDATLDKIFEPQPPGMAADKVAVLPPEFLYTKYVPLNDWLDQAVRVQIIDVRLLDVFNHQSLRGLQYHFVRLPKENPIINIDKLAMTRRQLLWVLAHDHQLHMTPYYGPRGEVTHIDIRSRSVDLPKSGISSGIVE